MKPHLELIGLRLEDHTDSSSELNVNKKCPKFSEEVKLSAQAVYKKKQTALLTKIARGDDMEHNTKNNNNFEDVFEFNNELFYELFCLDKMDDLKNYRKNIYLQHLEVMIKLNLRYAYVL